MSSSATQTPYRGLKKISAIVAGTFAIPLLLVSIFFITKSSSPYASELAFIEHSILGKSAGSVIPASCNSVPPTSHFTGDCPPVVNVSVSGTSQFIDFNFLVSGNNVVPKNGTVYLSWSGGGISSCTASGAWSGAKNPAGGEAIVNTNATLAQTQSVYVLTCTNGTRSVAKSVNLFFDGGRCLNHVCP